MRTCLFQKPASKCYQCLVFITRCFTANICDAYKFILKFMGQGQSRLKNGFECMSKVLGAYCLLKFLLVFFIKLYIFNACNQLCLNSDFAKRKIQIITATWFSWTLYLVKAVKFLPFLIVRMCSILCKVLVQQPASLFSIIFSYLI